MQVAFGGHGSGEFFELMFGAAADVRLAGPGVPEALKATPPELDKHGRRNGITVPQGARWVWLKFTDGEPDLDGEVVDVPTLERFASYTVSQAGWLDVEHWSRPNRFPAEWLKQGVMPTNFRIGKLTDLRFDGQTGYAEGFLWPEGTNQFADTIWQQLTLCPESLHCSLGGPPLSRDDETLPDGRKVKRLRLLMNHIAICSQGVNMGTEVSTAPLGEFAKSVVDGVSVEPDCDGGSCVACFIRGTQPHHDESAKAITARGAGGIDAQGLVPQHLDGAPTVAQRRATEDEEQPDGDQDDEDELTELTKAYLGEDGRFPDDETAAQFVALAVGDHDRARALIHLAREYQHAAAA